MSTTLDTTAAPAVEIFRLPAVLTEPTVASILAEPAMATKTFSLMGTGSMLLLAGLDLVGSYCAMRYLQTGHQAWWSAGAVSFVVLFTVYSASMRWVELGTVTLGWIVFLQIGVLVMDRVSNGTVVPPGKWIAMAAILGLMTYMLLAPNGKAYTPKHAGRPAAGDGVVAERNFSR